MEVLVLRLKDQENGGLKAYAETLRDKLKDGFVFLANEKDGKITFVAASSKAAIAKGVKAGALVKEVATIAGGGGGGRPDSAMAGAKNVNAVEEAMSKVEQIIKSML